jgi:hypothetical protein
VAGFSLHAAQWVPAHDREALERLLRYGLRAPFAQERLSRRPDGRVIYRLRRPWPNPQGATHLILEPHDFLRRLAALVSFPYSHAIRRHGVFANRSRGRRRLPPPPARDPQEGELLPAPPAERQSEAAPPLVPSPSDTSPSGSSLRPTRPRRRLSWAQLLRRVLAVDALSCPRCSRPGRSVPMVVLAFLTDPEVVSRILRHLGLPIVAPMLAPAQRSAEAEGFELGDDGGGIDGASQETEEWTEADGREPPTRPPP